MISPIELHVDAPSTVAFDVDTPAPVSIAIPTFALIQQALPDYDGALQIVPSNTVQVLQTHECSVHQDITVMPIPNNYGLITWDGSILTVS